ncbi:MAG: glucose-6-phosphate dehydrogenase assembly protein OpcA [Actinobacteria bacterium]|nr:glucose-6-phosphate dehydrogenase assembly protein OpcA [Actinomycetota bacterium]
MSALAHIDDWTGGDTTVAEIDRRLGDLRRSVEQEGVPDLRTSVLTHLAWVPPEYEQAATDTLAGLAERHPSRAILLVPEPEAETDGLDAEISVRCFSLPGLEAHVCSEVIELRLRGKRAVAPASIVSPLLIADLPVFIRWRGRPDFGSGPFEQLVELVDRLVVDSGEWADLPAAYAQLASLFDRVAASDIAWSRSLEWRRQLAGLWPGIASARRLTVAGPRADALLLTGWLRSRLERELELELEERPELERLAVDGAAVETPAGSRRSASDLLSAELEQFTRDPVYEQAVLACADVQPISA